jgi:hypothetical protein
MTVEFDPVSHTYKVDGVYLPNVTSILKEAGIVDDRFYNTWARDRGSAVHKAIQFHAEGDLDEASLDPVVTPYFHAYLRWRDEMVHWVPEFSELKVVNRTLGYAGTVDMGLITPPATRALVDFKTGALTRPVGLQLSAYALAAWEQERWMANRLIGVQLNEDGSYKMHEYKFEPEPWMAAVRVARWLKAKD